MPNDITTATLDAATKIQEASRANAALIWKATIANQERAVRLARLYVDEVRDAGAPDDSGLVDEFLANAQAAKDAGQQLALSYVAAGLSSLYFPFAMAEQVAAMAA